MARNLINPGYVLSFLLAQTLLELDKDAAAVLRRKLAELKAKQEHGSDPWLTLAAFEKSLEKRSL
jgi:hypothetical protein